MKLAICIVHNRDRNKLTDEMLKAGFKFTVIGSTGGFLREGNSTLLVGVDEELTASLKEIVQQCCKAREQMGTAADAGIPTITMMEKDAGTSKDGGAAKPKTAPKPAPKK